MFIYIYIADELKYDQHLELADRTYRISQIPFHEGIGERNAGTPFPLRDYLDSEHSHIFENTTRLFNNRARRLALFDAEDRKSFNETRFFFADQGVISIFDINLIRGNRETALRDPFSMIISETAAQRMFGDVDPMGKTLRFEGRIDLTITGIFKDIPQQSHFRFDQIASFQSLNRFFGGTMPDNWYWNPNWTYFQLKPGISVQEADAVLKQVASERYPPPSNETVTLKSQPIKDIWLRSELESEIQPVNNIQYIYIFATIGFLLLVIACINFLNLSTARASKRLKEASLRKIYGAHKPEIVSRFMGEALLLTLFAALISIVFVWILLPWFNAFTGKFFLIQDFFRPDFLIFLITTVLSLAFFSGLLPAVLVSRISPLQMLNNKGLSGHKGYLRYSLVLTQFVIAILLITGTLSINRQLDFLKEANLGFDKEQVIVIPVPLARIVYRYDLFHERLKNNPSILHVSATSTIVGHEYRLSDYTIEGMESEAQQFPVIMASDGFTELFGIDVLAGRSLSDKTPTDLREAVLVNESFVKRAGWGTNVQALGKWIRRDNFNFTVVGVVNDFNSTSLHKPVEPLIIEMPKNFPTQVHYINIKIAPGQVESIIPFIRDEFNREDPNRIFDFFYLDEELQLQYEKESKMGVITGLFSIICVIVACLGLFGLASFTTEMRSKSIGIRKVVGASVSGIVLLLLKEYTYIVIAANLIAIPLSWWLMNNWLQGFAYQASLDVLLFLLAAAITFITAIISVSYQTIRLALTDPVQTLRYE